MEKFIAAREFQQPLSIPRLQVFRESFGSDGFHNKTKWSFTTVMLEHSLFGVNTEFYSYNNYKIPLLQEKFEGYVRMAEYNLLRLHILIFNTDNNQSCYESNVKMFIELVNKYHDEFFIKMGPFDRIKENVRRRGLLQVLMKIIGEVEKWNVVEKRKELWEAIYLLIGCAIIMELQEQVINDVNRKSCQQLHLNDVFICITNKCASAGVETYVTRETLSREEMTEITIESLPYDEEKDFLYLIFYAEFELRYCKADGEENGFNIEIDMEEMNDPELKESHFRILENADEIEAQDIIINGKTAIKPNPIGTTYNVKLGALEIKKI